MCFLFAASFKLCKILTNRVKFLPEKDSATCVGRRQLLAYKLVDIILSRSTMCLSLLPKSTSTLCMYYSRSHYYVSTLERLYLVCLIVRYGVLFQINVVGNHLPSQNCYPKTHHLLRGRAQLPFRTTTVFCLETATCFGLFERHRAISTMF